jgi:heterodisulfide reductase subunit A-like polyferredoxin
MKTFDTLAHQQIFLNHCVLDKEITHLDVKELEKEETFNKELKQLSLLNHSYQGSESTLPMINYAQITSSQERIVVVLYRDF